MLPPIPPMQLTKITLNMLNLNKIQAAGIPILLKNKEQKSITVKILKNSAIILAKLAKKCNRMLITRIIKRIYDFIFKLLI